MASMPGIEGIETVTAKTTAPGWWEEPRSHSVKNLPVGRPGGFLIGRGLAELRSQGLSPRQIARAMGLGDGTVRRVLGGLIPR